MTWRRAIALLMLVGCADVAESAPDDGVEEAAEGERDEAFPILAIQNGVSVRGAGPQQQWEGIVMTMRRVGTNQASVCSATFITAQHLLTAAHCYDKAGVQSVSVRAPSWNGNAWQLFDKATVYQASGKPSYPTDIAVVDLGKAPDWVTPARRFRIFSGRPTATDLHIYGYGGRAETTAGIDGTLRTAPGNATVRITDGGKGYLTSVANAARVCTGDSGGPAIREGSLPVVWGINRSFSTNAFQALLNPNPVCPSTGASMQFTNISANMAFVEKSLGKPCSRIEVDGQPAAQCW